MKSYQGCEANILGLSRDGPAVLVAGSGSLEEVDLRTGKTRVLYEGTLGLLHAEGSVLRMALQKGSTIAVGTISGGQFVEEGTVPVGMPGFILRAWGTDGSCLYGVLHRGVTNQLVRVDLGSGRVDCLTEKGKTVQDRAGIGGLARSRKVLFACESPTEPVELWSASEGGAPEKVTQLNIAVSPQELPAVSVIRYGSDGWSMEALLVEPRSPRPSAGWPTLTYLHGGPERCVEASFSELISARAQSAAYWLASKGYAVFLPNFRGSSGYGEEFKAQIADYQLLRRPFADVMVGLNFLVERGTADPDRLGLYGSSYGGWLTAWAISQTGRFQGAVVALGYYDLLYRDRVSGKAFHSLTPNRLGTADPKAMWSAPEVYTHLSPMEHVAKVRTPVLLIETAAEARSQLGGGRAFCNGLWAQGVEASLVRYAEAFHQGGWTDEYKTDYANRLTAWFDHCLLGRPLPGWFLDAWAFAGI